MIYLPELSPYREKYETLEARTVKITCNLRNNRVAGFDPICFDNILAAAVVREAMQGRRLQNTLTGMYDIRVPLICLYEDERGRPLWASSALLPQGYLIEDRQYFHKRKQTGRYTGTKSGKLNLDSQRGRFMERRYIALTTVCDTLEAVAVGDPEEIARLLEQITHIGKYRSIGYGEVDTWEITMLSDTYDKTIILDDGRLIKDIPVSALETFGWATEEEPVMTAWTPPYWTGASMGEGWRIGTEVSV